MKLLVVCDMLFIVNDVEFKFYNVSVQCCDVLMVFDDVIGFSSKYVL